jgi:hypothetical protein
MPSLAPFEVVKRLPSLCSRSFGSIVGPCVALETSSFSLLVARPLSVLVTYLHVASLLGVATPMLVTLDSL